MTATAELNCNSRITKLRFARRWKLSLSRWHKSTFSWATGFFYMFSKLSTTLNHQSNRWTDTSGTFVPDSSRPVEEKKKRKKLYKGSREKNTHATLYEDLITTLACSPGIPEVALLCSFGILFTQCNEAGVRLLVCEGACVSDGGWEVEMWRDY